MGTCIWCRAEVGPIVGGEDDGDPDCLATLEDNDPDCPGSDSWRHETAPDQG